MLEVEVVGVRIELPSNQPLVLLKEKAGERHIPIWIGAPEASAIAFAQQGIKPPRPMTHDLLKNLLGELNAHVDRIVINDLRENTFFARIHLTRGDSTLSVDSRPSDAIALALRSQAEIFVEEEVLEKSRSLRSDSDQDPDRLKKWLEEASADELGKYRM